MAQRRASRSYRDFGDYFSGALISDHEQIGSVIEASDPDVRVGFDRALDGQGFSAIRLLLEPGQAVTMRKSAEAILVASDTRQRVFHARTPSDKTRNAQPPL